MRRIISLAVVLAVLVPLGAQPSQATFPGSNGKIAFASFGDGPNRIGVIDPDGDGLTFVTSPERRLDWEPSWSDDGATIVFDTLTREYDHPKIMTMAADGTDPTVVYEAPDRVKDIYRPVWSPDANQIAFCGAVGRAYLLQIFTMNADGSSVTNISGSKHPDDCFPTGPRTEPGSRSHPMAWRRWIRTERGGPWWSPTADGPRGPPTAPRSRSSAAPIVRGTSSSSMPRART